LSSVAPKTTILVVEDDPDLRSLYRTALTAAGYAVVAANDGVAALRALENNVPDAVVLDLGLPRLGGRDFHAELASHNRTANVPVVVVTGEHITERDQKQFSCVLRKPVHVEALIYQIENCLRRGSRLHDRRCPEESGSD
jgi:DNA-binding response OmpR family regulator